MQLLHVKVVSLERLAGQKAESGGTVKNGMEVQVGEGTLTIATIFLTAFRRHVRGRGERIGF